MKKDEIKNDLILFNKLQDNNYRFCIDRAHRICIDLNINNILDYYLYQIYIDDLKKVTYEEIISYDRLLNFEYFENIKLLYQQIVDDNKIIIFPKIN